MVAYSKSSLVKPFLNEVAPDFCANTTHGIKDLSSYKGKWLLLFSHPADFTSVCTTEFMAFAKNYDQFQMMCCNLLSLSINSNCAHLTWIRNVEEKFGIKIPFPIIEDPSMTVAHDYGMARSGKGDTSSVRATFFIDPESVLRAMVYYPMSDGRNVAEFLRVLGALQASDARQSLDSERKQAGNQVVLPLSKATRAARKRSEEHYVHTDWYFSRNFPGQEIATAQSKVHKVIWSQQHEL